MSNEPTVYEGQEEGTATQPQGLIALALKQNADPGTLEKLMALQERWEAGNARKAYVLAMSAFKQEAPAVLKKHDKVDFTTAKGRTSYNYANLGSIVTEVSAMLGKHELSASWQTGQNDKNDISVTCHITHSAGHRESVTLKGPADISGNKNQIQAVGSTVTYLQRYTLLAALGLATMEDDDGLGGQKGKPPISAPKTKTQSRAETDTDVSYVEGMEIKKGEKNGKAWTLFKITISGVVYSTFDKKHGEIATVANKGGLPVVITSETTAKGENLKTIEIAQIAGEAEKPKATGKPICSNCETSYSCEKEIPKDGQCADYVPVETTQGEPL